MAVQAPRLRSASTLLASYFVFGVYWGVWVVVFADYLADRGLSEGRAGLLLAALSVSSIVTMTLLAPRLQRLGVARTVPLGHLSMGLGGGAGALGAGIPLAAGAPFRVPLGVATAAFGVCAVWCALSPWLRAQPAPT